MIPIAATFAQTAPSERWSVGTGARIAHAVVLALLNQAGLIIPLAAIAPLLLGGGDPFDAAPGSFLLLAIIIALQAGLVVGLGLCRVGRVTLCDLGWRTDHLGADVARGMLGGAATIAIVVGLRFFLGGVAAVSDVWVAVASYSIAQRMLFVGIGVIAAFAEESIFRGYLQPTFVRRFGSVAGVVATAAFFAVYHLQFSPSRLMGLLLLGLVYGALKGQDRSLFGSAIAHGLCWAVLGAV